MTTLAIKYHTFINFLCCNMSPLRLREFAHSLDKKKLHINF